MKKTAAGVALAAVLGMSVVSAAPAMALTPTGQFEDCGEARNMGVYNILASDPRYGVHLDRDLGGVGCENGDEGTAVVEVPAAPAVDPAAPVDVAAPAPVQAVAPQIIQVPVGAPATGVAQENNADSLGALLAAGAVVAAAGVAVAARRKSANA